MFTPPTFKKNNTTIVSPHLVRTRMQTAALMTAISVLIFTLAPIVLPTENGEKKKLKTDFPSYENLDLDSDDITLDNYEEILDLSNYEDIYDYEDPASKVLNN